mgnify:CR=1 FL=1
MNQICNRCINDQTIPGIEFDKNGICNHCSVHETLCKTYPIGVRIELSMNQVLISK